MIQSATALALSGGGARGAYQSGVLKAISEICHKGENPFPIICGVSAGAINAALQAAAILGNQHAEIRAALRRFRDQQTAQVLAQPDPRVQT